MKEHNYHPTYKHYISSSEAFESPLEPGEYMVSAFATLIEPPPVENGKIQIFNENQKTWSIIDDFRGYYYNIFDGCSIYNEVPTIKPKNYTLVAPPDDYNVQDYKWDLETNSWKKLNKIYKIELEKVNNLTIQEKFEILGISVSELRELLDLDSNETDRNNEIKKISDEYTSKIDNLINLSLYEKLNFLNIKIDDLKNLLEIHNFIKNQDLINLSIEEKFNFFGITSDSIKNLFEYDELKTSISRCYVELNLLNYQVNHYRNTIIDSLSNIKSEYIHPINLSEILILRPVEIIQTSAKFEYADEILPAGFIGICIDTGERKFGDGVSSWNRLDFVDYNQKYRFSKTLQEWEDQNPIPGENIECYEIDTGNLKVGNGFSTWDKLPYEAT